MPTAANTTLHTIAQRAGVSLTTASNVLNRNRVGKRSDAVANARKIRKIADQLGYRPNMAARAMQTKRFNAIGLLRSVAPSSGGISGGTVYEIEKVAAADNLHVVMGELSDAALSSEGAMPKILREWAADGLLVAHFNPPQPMIEMIARFRVPTVWVNAKGEHDCVYSEDYGSTRSATEHLLGLGHRRILYSGPKAGSHFSARDRAAGYSDAMAAAGLTASFFHEPLSTLEKPADPVEGAGRFRDVLNRDDRPTAILHLGSITKWYVSALRLGLSVPGDLSLMSIRDPQSVASHVISPDIDGRVIAAIDIPVWAVGAQAVRMLQQKIETPAEPIPARSIPYSFVTGQTCGPAGK